MAEIVVPTKQNLFYVLEMLEAFLIDSRYVHPWADDLISSLDQPPPWLCELAVQTYQGDLIRVIREHLCDEPFAEPPREMEKFFVACLWLCYERREISWASFLGLAGDRLDCASADWCCETPYHYLNLYEDSYFSSAVEELTKEQYLAEQDLRPWIKKARVRFEPFLQWRLTSES